MHQRRGWQGCHKVRKQEVEVRKPEIASLGPCTDVAYQISSGCDLHYIIAEKNVPKIFSPSACHYQTNIHLSIHHFTQV